MRMLKRLLILDDKYALMTRHKPRRDELTSNELTCVTIILNTSFLFSKPKTNILQKIKMSTKTGKCLVVRVPDGGTPTMEKEELPLPEPGSNQLLVKTSHVAQNPTDGRFNVTMFTDKTN